MLQATLPMNGDSQEVALAVKALGCGLWPAPILLEEVVTLDSQLACHRGGLLQRQLARRLCTASAGLQVVPALGGSAPSSRALTCTPGSGSPTDPGRLSPWYGLLRIMPVSVMPYRSSSLCPATHLQCSKQQQLLHETSVYNDLGTPGSGRCL